MAYFDSNGSGFLCLLESLYPGREKGKKIPFYLIQTKNHKSVFTQLEGGGLLVSWLPNHLPLLKQEMEASKKIAATT